MFVQVEGSLPKRCLYCGGAIIEGVHHECITSGGWQKNDQGVNKKQATVEEKPIGSIDWKSEAERYKKKADYFEEQYKKYCDLYLNSEKTIESLKSTLKQLL